MKDEIKEIIDRLERIDHKEYVAFEFADSATFDEMARCFEERKKMADCITNLQEENERLKEEIENLTHIVANKIIEDYDIDTPLKNQLNEERIKYVNLGVVCNDYKSKCEKAIEYIRSEYTITDDDVYLALYSSDGTLGKLETILKGDEDE